MFAIFLFALALISASSSAPLSCEDLVRPLDNLDPHHLNGTYALVLASLKDKADEDSLKGRDSVTFHFRDSVYVQVNRVGEQCDYNQLNLTITGGLLTLDLKTLSFTGTVTHTSCQDCLVFTLKVRADNYTSEDFYLLSRRQQLEQEEVDEFEAQAKCLKMPQPMFMDHTKELCPEVTLSKSEEDKTETKTE